MYKTVRAIVTYETVIHIVVVHDNWTPSKIDKKLRAMAFQVYPRPTLHFVSRTTTMDGNTLTSMAQDMVHQKSQ
jgi:hypothetical protein